MAELQVNIVTPQRLAYSGTAAEIRVPAWEGEMGVLPGHDTLLALIRGGVVTVAGPGGDKRFVVGRGFAEVGPDRVVVLTDLCEPAESVNREQAQRDFAAAEQSLTSTDAYSPEWEVAQTAIEVARARLTV